MIAVIDYGIGNLRSAEKALLRVGGDARLITDPDDLAGATGVVLPGVGAFGACATALVEAGFDEPIKKLVADGLPFLGLCVGFQLLFESSVESPEAKGLGILPGVIQRLFDGVKLPQMQWNAIEKSVGGPSAMLRGLPLDPWFYFVHTYAAMPADMQHGTVSLVANYGGEFVAGIERDNIWGTQFHPEKSGAVGLTLLANFVALCNVVGDTDNADGASDLNADENINQVLNATTKN